MVTGTAETRLGLEHCGQATNLWPSESFLPSSTKSLWRTLEGETRAEAEWFRSLLAALGEVRLMMLAMALRGEILRPKKFSFARFSFSLFISDMKASLRWSWLLQPCKADAQVEETWRGGMLQ